MTEAVSTTGTLAHSHHRTMDFLEVGIIIPVIPALFFESDNANFAPSVSFQTRAYLIWLSYKNRKWQMINQSMQSIGWFIPLLIAGYLNVMVS